MRTLASCSCLVLLSGSLAAGCVAQTETVDGSSSAASPQSDGPPPSDGTQIGGVAGTCDGPTCDTGLAPDPVMACFHATVAPVQDRYGNVHDDALDAQLALAMGILNARIGGARRNVCGGASYDCGGVFYDSPRHPVRVPAFPWWRATSDADVTAWQDDVRAFYQSVYTDKAATKPLADGKAMLCTDWAKVYFQAHPDPSILEVLVALQAVGAEDMVGQDFTWLDNIVAAATQAGCAVPPLLVGNFEEGWWIPRSAMLSIHKRFRDCQAPWPDIGGCPHPFDAPNGPGNHVNDDYLFDAESCGPAGTFEASAAVGDPTGGCGLSCYKRGIVKLPRFP